MDHPAKSWQLNVTLERVSFAELTLDWTAWQQTTSFAILIGCLINDQEQKAEIYISRQTPREFFTRRFLAIEIRKVSRTKREMARSRFIGFSPNFAKLSMKRWWTKMCSHFRFNEIYSEKFHSLLSLLSAGCSINFSALYQRKYNACQNMRTHFC